MHGESLLKYVFLAAFIAVFIACGNELGFTVSSPLHTHFTYMFQHAGIWHLAMNALAFYSMFTVLARCTGQCILAVITVVCAFAASFLSAHDTPTVGASSMVYAMMGMYIAMALRGRRMVIRNGRQFGMYCLCVVICLAASFFREGSNFTLHLVSLVFGGAASVPAEVLKFKV